jgi:toxin-antitoxin system PIN domain toxin
MKLYLVDVNVWLALMAPAHEHHRVALNWYEGLDPRQAGMCRMVQLSLIRLLANPTIFGKAALAVSAAWKTIEHLMEDERIEFLAEPPDIEGHFGPLLKYNVPTGKLVADAWLAAFAISLPRTLLTLDGGFRQFRGVDMEILKD